MALRIGFDRRLQLSWLDGLVDQLVIDTHEQSARSRVRELLAEDGLAGEARQKTETLLMRMWVTISPRHEEMRKSALDQVRQGAVTDRRWLHWGMALLSFPLFAATASTVGRLQNVQGDLTMGQVQHRLTETFGQRSTIERASQRIVRSILDWGLLESAGRRGSFRRSATQLEASANLQLWLLQAAFTANGAEEIEASQLLAAPELFPFRITVRPGDLRSSERFEIHRQGIDMDIVALRGSASN